MLDERGDIGADEHLAVADAEHQRRRAAGGDDRARLVGVGEHQREVALQPAQHGQHRGDEVAGGVAVLVLPGDQVHGDLGVGVAGELHAGGLQLVAQVGEVLDDAVVDDGDLAGGVAVRVGVAVGGPAVGGPAGVAHPGGARSALPGRFGVQRGFQVGQPAGTAAHRQSAATVDQGDTGGVVAPVLHSAQRIHHDIAGGTVPDVADDSAHSATQYCSRRRQGQTDVNQASIVATAPMFQEPCSNYRSTSAHLNSVACSISARLIYCWSNAETSAARLHPKTYIAHLANCLSFAVVTADPVVRTSTAQGREGGVGPIAVA